MALRSRQKLNVFLYFAEKDRDLHLELKNHLVELGRMYGFFTCSNDQIPPGKDSKETLQLLLDSADLVLLLMSADFTADQEYYAHMQSIFERQHEKRTNAVFVHLRPCIMPQDPFGHTNTFPRRDTVTTWGDKDSAFVDVCKSIEKKLLSLNGSWDPTRKLAHEDYERYQQKYLEREIAESDQDIEAKRNVAEAYAKKGNALGALGRYKEAIRMLDEAIKLNPNKASAYLNKGKALYARRRFKKAVSVLDKAISLNAYNPVAFLFKGMALYRLRRHQEAISALKEAINLDPCMYYTAAFKDRTLRALGHFEDDILILKETLLVIPYNPATIYSGRGSIFGDNIAPLVIYAVLILLLFLVVIAVGYELLSFGCPKKALLPWVCTHINPLNVKPSTQASAISQKPDSTPTPSASLLVRYFMQKYYDHINKHEYMTAYLLWQMNQTGRGEPYAKFVEDYGNTLHDDITITEVVPDKKDATFDITIIIAATERNNIKAFYRAHYIIEIAADGSCDIIDGDAKKI